MATLTSLGFTIFSRYDGTGVARARRDLNDLNNDLERSQRRLNQTAGGFHVLSTAAVTLAPAIFPIATAVAGVTAATASLAVVGGTALGVYGTAMAGAITQTLKMAEAHQKLSPVQATFVKSVDNMKGAWNSFINSTQNMTLTTATLVVQGLTGAIGRLAPLVRAVHPVLAGVAQDFKNWAAGEGFKRFIDLVIKYGVPALKGLVAAGKDVLATLGIGFRATLPLVQPLVDALRRGAAAMREWAEGGGFSRFVANVQSVGPQVGAFFRALWDAVAQLSKAMAGLGPISLSLATALLRLVASLPIPVLQAFLVLFVAWKAAMLGVMIIQSVTTAVYAFGTALAAARVAWAFLNAAFISSPIGWLVLALGALVAAIVYIATQTTWFQTVWTYTWNAVKLVAVTVWNFLTQGLGQFALALLGPIGVLAILALNWRTVWTGMQIAAQAVWAALTIAWQAFITGLTIIWQVMSAGFVMAWQAVWTAVSIATQAIWNGILIAYQVFLNTMILVGTTILNALQLAWTVSWNAISVAVRVIWAGIQIAYQAFMSAMLLIGNTFLNAMSVAWNAVWNAIRVAVTAIWNAMTVVYRAIVTTLSNITLSSMTYISNIWNSAWNFIKNLANTIWQWMVNTWRAIVTTLSNLTLSSVTYMSNIWNSAWNFIKNVANTIWHWLTATWKSIVTTLSNLTLSSVTYMSNVWNSAWNFIKNVANSIWNWLTSTWRSAVTTLSNVTTSSTNFIKNTWNKAWDAVKAHVQKIWEDIKKIVKDAVKAVIAPINKLIDGFNNVTKALKMNLSIPKIPTNFATGGMVPEYAHGGMVNLRHGGSVRGYAPGKDRVPAMLSPGEGVLTPEAVRGLGGPSFVHRANRTWAGHRGAGKGHKGFNRRDVNRWTSRQGGMGFATGGMVPGMQHFAVGGLVSAALARAGISLGLVTQGEYSNGALSAGTHSGGGVVDIAANPANQAAMVAALRAAGFAAWFRTPSEGFAYHIHAVLMSAPDLSAAAKAQVASYLAGGNGLANGGPDTFGGGIGDILGNVVDIIRKLAQGKSLADALDLGGGFLGGVIDFLSGGAGAILESLAPMVLMGMSLANVTEGFDFLLDPINDLKLGGGVIGEMLKGAAQQLSKGAMEWLANKAAEMAPAMAMMMGGGGGGVQQWSGLAATAMAMAGLSLSQLPKFLALMQAESGGNPMAINNWDSNAAAGMASRGLMQVIPPTFAAYHVPGTSMNIFDPLANMAAAANYIKHVYGGNVPGSPYRLGTPGATRGWHLVGEDGPEYRYFRGGEKVLPHGEMPPGRGGWDGGHVNFHQGAFHFEFKGNVTREALEYAEGDLCEKLRQAVHAGVGKRPH